tara:strand:+ start:575 stop:1192 length:618 start_codon:yes stop_codon:yes gene_type:complete
MDQHDHKNMEVMDRFRLIRSGDTVVDVGACHGVYMGYFTYHLGFTGKIYCVELSPSNMEYLKQKYQDKGNIEFVTAAASDSDGSITYHKGVTDQTFTILDHDTSFKKLEEEGIAESITLDTLLKDETNIKMIKIDVEGAELKVLKGMKDTANKVQTMLLENHFDEDWPEIRQILLEEYGFTCYDVERETAINMNSNRPYQCLCTR